MGYNYVHAVTRTVGYCLYGTLLLRPCWTACPIQIRAHHHIDVYTDSNEHKHDATFILRPLSLRLRRFTLKFYFTFKARVFFYLLDYVTHPSEKLEFKKKKRISLNDTEKTLVFAVTTDH